MASRLLRRRMSDRDLTSRTAVVRLAGCASPEALPAGRILPIPSQGPPMTSAPFAFRLEQPADAPIIEALHAELFGPERFKRAAYVLRDGVPPDPTLSFVATLDGDARRVGAHDADHDRRAPGADPRAAGRRARAQGQGRGQGARPHGARRGAEAPATGSSCWSATCPTTGRSASRSSAATSSRCRPGSTRTGCWSPGLTDGALDGLGGPAERAR